MADQQPPKPLHMLVSTVGAEVQNLRDELQHARLVPAGIGFLQQLLDKVCGEQETVLLEDALVTLQIPDVPALDFRDGENLSLLAQNPAFLGFPILACQRLAAGCHDVLAVLQQPCSLQIAFCNQSLLFVFSNLSNDLVVEVLDDVEVVEDHAQMRAFLLERLLEIRIHVKGDSLDVGHPFQPDVLDEVVDDLLLLSLCNPEDMAVRHVDDVRRILVAVVQLELVDAEETRLFFGAAEPPVLDVELFQPPLVDGFHNVLADARELADFLVGEGVLAKEDANILFQFLRDAVVLGLERDFLHMRMAAVRAEVLDVLKPDAADAVAERKMLQCLLEALVDMHAGAAGRAAAISWSIQRAIHAEGSAAGRQDLAGRVRVVEAMQRRGNQEVFLLWRFLSERKRELLKLKIFDIIHGEDIPLCGFTLARCISTS